MQVSTITPLGPTLVIPASLPFIPPNPTTESIWIAAPVVAKLREEYERSVRDWAQLFNGANVVGTFDEWVSRRLEAMLWPGRPAAEEPAPYYPDEAE